MAVLPTTGVNAPETAATADRTPRIEMDLADAFN